MAPSRRAKRRELLWWTTNPVATSGSASGTSGLSARGTLCSLARRDLRCSLVEALHLAAGVDDALLAGEEGVAVGADLGLELLARGAGRERVAAHAGDDRVFVKGGM